jgi:UDP-N-acetylmuramoyl-L-alanyl-D-glutamate--2,6-diaminopimelate ligase
MVKLCSLLERVDYALINGNTDIEIENISYDSRTAQRGDVLVCIKGIDSDGHEYIQEGLEKGIKALIVEKDIDYPKDITVLKVENSRIALAEMSAAYFGHPAEKLKTIGVTGTKGKTTTTYMIKELLEKAGYKVGLIGTIEISIGSLEIEAENTTPESYVVQKYFRKMVDAGCNMVVMEVSSQGLMLNRVSGFIFDYGIFTNI